MQTNALGSQPRVAIRNQSKRSEHDKCSTVHVGRSISAERQRVFLALTVPEYMETWLVIPGAAQGRVMVARDTDSFSVYCLNGDGHSTIRCSYRTCNSDKLLFLWRHDAVLSTHPSLVTIRLMGEFERTNLELIHTGLDQSMLGWHQELWDTSLARLSSLFYGNF